MHINDNSAKHWTPVTLECLERGFNCTGCFYNEFFKRSWREGSHDTCRVKASVMKLIRLLGLPKDIQQPTTLDESEADNEF
jgi:hypothetical protein